MLLQRFHDDALAQTSYLLGCQASGLALVVDPNRDVQAYVAAAAKHRLRIVFVAESHIHADFVSGARELARETGATLLLSGEAEGEWAYRVTAADNARLVHDGDEIEVGRILLRVLHTPGHTPEHIAILVTDRTLSAHPVGMFSGDFIFAGDVGRPDLLERSANVRGSMDRLARTLFHSLQRMAALPDYLQLWPGHGAGSACGKSLGSMPSTTLGYERLTNWALREHDEERFVHDVLTHQPEPPAYFALMKTINRDGPLPVSDDYWPQLGMDDVHDALHEGDSVVDVRPTAAFAREHIAGSLNIPLGTSFSTWAGSLLPYDRPIVLLADTAEQAHTARRLLSLIGHDEVAGWCDGSVRDAWREAGKALAQIPQVSIADISGATERRIIDVRGAAEWDAGHIPGAERLFLGELDTLASALPKDAPIAVHCQGGTRSAIAASLLARKGFTNVANVRGGFDAWAAAGLPVERAQDR